MIHYHGLPITPETACIAAVGGGHAFVSYPNRNQLNAAVSVCQSLALDNGAFPAWKAGKPVQDWRPFYEWAGQCKLLPMSHRPRYYLVWVDSAWFDGEYAKDAFRDNLDDIWLALEDEFGCRDQYSEARYRWPQVDDLDGCCWAIADADAVLTWKKRRAWIPSFDDGIPHHRSADQAQGGLS